MQVFAIIFASIASWVVLIMLVRRLVRRARRNRIRHQAQDRLMLSDELRRARRRAVR